MSKLFPVAWITAGLAFAAYPALRPYADETAMPGLAAMASDRWVVAHLIGMVAFVLLAAGLCAVNGRLANLAAVAVVLLLPYYGGESFGLHAIGRRAVTTGDVGLLMAVNAFRYQPIAISMFGAGLLLLAAVGVLLVVATWRQSRGIRSAAMVAGLGLLLYLPQFYGSPEMRIGHGVLLGLGCVALGLTLARRATARAVTTSSGSAEQSAGEAPWRAAASVE